MRERWGGEGLANPHGQPCTPCWVESFRSSKPGAMVRRAGLPALRPTMGEAARAGREGNPTED
jgi:hypothetical protein